MSGKQKEKKLFFGWIIVLCGAVVLGVTHGVVTNCFSLYIIPVSGDLGVSREAFTICTMVVNMLYAVFSFTYGAISRKLPVKTTMRLAAVILPAAYFCYSFCNSVTGFYLCAGVVGISVSFITFLPFTHIISNWFEEKRGKALGICFMGSGLGGMVMNSLTAFLLENYGWRTCYRVTGVVMLAVLVPLIFFVIRVTPEEKGTKALGLGAGKPEQAKVFGPTAGRAFRSVSFYALVLLALIIGFGSTVIGNVVAPHLCDLGYSTAYASNLVSVYLGALAVAKIFLGTLYDKIGARKGTAVSLLGFMVGFLGLLLGKLQLCHLLIFIGAVGTASSNVSYPVLARYAFGTRDYTTLYGVLMGMNFVTCSFGAVIANSIFGATGSYNGALLICEVLFALGLLTLPLIRPVPEDTCPSGENRV